MENKNGRQIGKDLKRFVGVPKHSILLEIGVEFVKINFQNG